ncbi:BSP-domain-containing protein [Amniculicola lignicola CBS 123094]|uniref:BSP-domain-containing protein n=1 Tax=Amniculicola lignicola CBS 123094 TaxID=1392246 RepID=A0A6A5W6Z1_9PLEO|nr:BSP-domain-containing protein [Amniculicola lignicola CBS 123094]
MSPAPTSTSSPPAPQSSAMPPSNNPASETSATGADTTAPGSAPEVKPSREALLRLEIRDLSSPGASTFLRVLHASHALDSAVSTVLRLLYTDLDQKCIPGTRSVTLVLRSMSGVAYTTGLDIDSDHKEIHLSTDYISRVDQNRVKEEINGVLVHEMVHCWQHNASGTAPGGLIEGIADWVRLKANLGPPHWKRDGDCNWDAGYERTGYFLEWLEKEHGTDIVRKINEGLRECGEYKEEEFWKGCCGSSVKNLWHGYQKSLAGHDKDPKEDQGQKEGEAPDKKGNEEENQHSSGDPLASSAPENEKAKAGSTRRGGRMHIPVRPPLDT